MGAAARRPCWKGPFTLRGGAGLLVLSLLVVSAGAWVPLQRQWFICFAARWRGSSDAGAAALEGGNLMVDGRAMGSCAGQGPCREGGVVFGVTLRGSGMEAVSALFHAIVGG